MEEVRDCEFRTRQEAQISGRHMAFDIWFRLARITLDRALRPHVLS